MKFSMQKTLLVMAAAAAFAPIQSLAIVTLQTGMHPDKLQEYEAVVKAACGELGEAARSKSANAKIVGTWSEDQYTTQVDQKAGATKYGNHLTIETFDGPTRTGRWHLYQSGAVWVDRKGDGKSSSESCHN